MISFVTLVLQSADSSPRLLSIILTTMLPFEIPDERLSWADASAINAPHANLSQPHHAVSSHSAVLVSPLFRVQMSHRGFPLTFHSCQKAQDMGIPLSKMTASGYCKSRLWRSLHSTTRELKYGAKCSIFRSARLRAIALCHMRMSCMLCLPLFRPFTTWRNAQVDPVAWPLKY